MNPDAIQKQNLPAPMGSFPPSGTSDSFAKPVSKNKSGKWDQKAPGVEDDGDVIVTGTASNPYARPKQGPPLQIRKFKINKMV